MNVSIASRATRRAVFASEGTGLGPPDTRLAAWDACLGYIQKEAEKLRWRETEGMEPNVRTDINTQRRRWWIVDILDRHLHFGTRTRATQARVRGCCDKF